MHWAWSEPGLGPGAGGHGMSASAQTPLHPRSLHGSFPSVYLEVNISTCHAVCREVQKYVGKGRPGAGAIVVDATLAADPAVQGKCHLDWLERGTGALQWEEPPRTGWDTVMCKCTNGACKNREGAMYASNVEVKVEVQGYRAIT